MPSTPDDLASDDGSAPSRRPRSVYATGVGLGVAAYAMWGVFPLYWPLLEPASALEILAHRFLWSLSTFLLFVRLLSDCISLLWLYSSDILL